MNEGSAWTVSEFSYSMSIAKLTDEWLKVYKYIQKGSDFARVGAACRRNKFKIQARYSILKYIGFEDEAKDFLRGVGIIEISTFPDSDLRRYMPYHVHIRNTSFEELHAQYKSLLLKQLLKPATKKIKEIKSQLS